MSLVHIRNHASTADANPQVVSLAGKTDGRDLWICFSMPATPTLPTNWVEHGSYLAGGGAYYDKLWRLPAASNTSGVTQISIAMNGPASIAAVVWEDTEILDTGVSVYFNMGEAPATDDTPALFGTRVHTFTSRHHAFAVYVTESSGATPTWDLVSYDNSFTDFGDSGWPSAGGASVERVWIAKREPFSVTSDGITATATGPRVTGVMGGSTGMIAYSSVAASAPTISLSPTTLTFSGTAGGSPPATQSISLTNIGVGTLNYTISDDAAWVSVSPTSGTAPGTLVVTVDPASLGAATHTATITVSASGATNTPQTVGITFNVASGATSPANTAAPTISGAGTTGSVLTCTTGTWTGTPTPTYAYQWKKNGTNIGGATASTYTLVAGDVGAAIKCTVTATNASGSASADSNTVTPTSSPKLTIAQENALTGIAEGLLQVSGAGDTANQGFCREFSVNVGETAHFSCSGPGVAIDIYRCGWYGGNGFAFKQRITNTATTQPAPTTVSGSNSGVTCTGWSTTASWVVPGNATPGLYMGLYRNVAENNGSWIPFVVRDDARAADIMVKVSDATWALAYNYFGAMGATIFQGKSVYGSGGPIDGSTGITGRTHFTTYHKPIVTRQGVSQTYWYNAEAPLIRYLERMGFDVTYTASKDWRESGPITPPACKIYISSGHDEYWDQGMRDKWEALRNAGKHLIFMSGNEVFWRTRFTDGGDNMWCYKDTMTGPSTHVAGVPLDPVSWTGTWKDTRWAGRKPENTITGTDFRLNGLNAITLVVAAPERSHTFWRSTDVGASGFTSGAGIVGFEADEALPVQPTASVTYLAKQTFAASGIYADANGENYNGTKASFDYRIVAQRYSSGAVVVGFGSCQWAWGLDDIHDRGTAVANSRIQQATANLLRDLGAAAPATLIAGLTSPTPQSLDNYGLGPASAISPARLHRRLSDGSWQELAVGGGGGGSGTVIGAGTGLTKTGDTLDVIAGAGLAVTADSVAVASNGITNAMLADGAVDLASADVTNMLPLTKGGTGAASAAAARTALGIVQTYTFRTSHTWAVVGAITVGMTIPGIFLPEAATQATTIVGFRAVVLGGTNATVQLTRNGSALGSATAVTTTATTTTLSQAVTANDLIRPTITAISGTPADLTYSLLLEHAVT